jgi:hypothetical protein
VIRSLVLILALAFSGCTAMVPEAAINVVEVATAAADRYAILAQQTLGNNKIDLTGTPGQPWHPGVAPIAAQDLDSTPPNVRLFLARLLKSLHAQRYGWHSVRFQLDRGGDPDLMGLKPIGVDE